MFLHGWPRRRRLDGRGPAPNDNGVPGGSAGVLYLSQRRDALGVGLARPPRGR
jgi:hypothetical protein